MLVADARAQWAELDRRISAFDAEFVRWVKENEEARRLTTIPGVGAIVRIRPRRRRRSGGKLRARTRSRRMARPGSPSVHHGRQAEAARDQQTRQQIPAQAADPWSAGGVCLMWLSARRRLGRWAKELMSSAHRNVAIVAFANKLARIAWAVLRRGERFAAIGIPMAA